MFVGNAALLAHIQQISPLFALSSADVLLHVNAFTFDAALELLWLGLTQGCHLHLQQSVRLSVADFYQYTNAHRITVTDVPPIGAAGPLADRGGTRSIP